MFPLTSLAMARMDEFLSTPEFAWIRVTASRISRLSLVAVGMVGGISAARVRQLAARDEICDNPWADWSSVGRL